MRVPASTSSIAATLSAATTEVIERAAELPRTIHGIDAARATTYFGSRGALLDGVEATFELGRIVGAGGREPFVTGNGSTGLLYTARLHGPQPSALTGDAVFKRAGAQQEAFAWRVARALGLEELVPVARLREPGFVAMGKVDGATFDRVGITDAAGLRAVLVAHHEAKGLFGAAAAEAAERDHHMLAAFDWIIANRDRKVTNAMLSSNGTPAFIDNAGALRGEWIDPLVPRLKPDLYPVSSGMPNAIVLPRSVRERIARSLTDDVLADAHAQLATDVDDLRPVDQLMLGRARDSHQLERLRMRRDHAASVGVLEFTPVDDVTRAEDTGELHRLALGGGGLWPTASIADARVGARSVQP